MSELLRVTRPRAGGLMTTAAMIAGLVACSSQSVGRIDAAELGTSRALAIVVDAAGAPTRVVGPWALDASPAPVVLSDDDVAVLLVGLADAALQQQAPALDLAQALVARIGVACAIGVDGQPARDLVIPADAPILRVSPGDARSTRVGRDAAPAADRVVLRGQLDFGRCDRPGEAFRAFGSSPEAVPPGFSIGGVAQGPANGISGILRLNRDLAVVSVGASILLLQRGEPYRDLPGHAVRVPDTPAQIVGLALSRAADGRATVVAVGVTASGGALWELPLIDGRLGDVVTATRTGADLVGVTTDEQGAVAAIGLDGLVLFAEAGASSYRATADLALGPRSIVATPDPRVPHLIATNDATVYEGDARTGRFQARPVVRAAQRFNVVSVAWTDTGQGIELWAGAELGLYHRAPNGEWGPYAIDLPPGLARCAAQADACGVLGVADRVHLLAVDGRGSAAQRRLFVQFLNCSGLAVLSPATECAGHLSRNGNPTLRLPPAELTSAIRAEDGWLMIGTGSGQLLELELSP